MTRMSIYNRFVPLVTPPTELEDNAYVFAFAEGKILLKTAGQTASTPSVEDLRNWNIVAVRTQYLGILEGKNCYSADLPPGAIAPAGTSLVDLRSSYGLVDEDIYLLAGRALQIVTWDQTNQFCGRCGHPTETMHGERGKKCPACGLISYPRLSPAVIAAIVREDKILLARRAGVRGRMFSILAGFVEPGETLEECLKREVYEEVGIRVQNLKYFASQPWPFPNSLMLGFTAEYESGEIKVDGLEVGEAGWFDSAHLPEIPPKMTIARELIDWFVLGSTL